MKPRRKSPLRAALKLAGAGALLILGGCSSAAQPINPTWADLSKPFFRDAKMDGPPRVENCGIIAISTPSTFECNGKKYTTLELADIREGKTPPPLLSSPQPSTPRGLIQR
jgi:hypothetical protein